MCVRARIRGPPGRKSRTPISHWNGHTGSLDETRRRRRSSSNTRRTIKRAACVCVYRLHKRPNNAHRGLTYLYNMCSVSFKRFRWVVPSPVAVRTRTHVVHVSKPVCVCARARARVRTPPSLAAVAAQCANIFTRCV